jgi:hypothetical protein
MAVKALNDLGTGALVRTDDLAQVFRVELTRECCGVHQVAEQDGELAPFRVGRTWDVSSNGSQDIRHQ